jgi:predicted DNA-binding transcriptional regulator YafY
MTVADTIEIASWIRGWGPEVEVLAPAELRAQFANEAAAAIEMYRDD